MRISLLPGAMLLLSALVSAVPLPSVTMVVTEIRTVIQNRSSPKFLSTILPTIPPTITSTTASTTSSTNSTSLDPYEQILALLALLTPPASLSSELAQMSSSAVPGMAGIQALGSYVEEIANSSWLATVSASDLAYESSEASIAASIMPEILSLGNAEFTILLSKQAVVASSLAEAESSLSSKVFTTITTAFGTETAVVTEPILVPIVTHQKAKLTPGQKIGLGIGIPAFILLALGIGFVVFHVRRNRVRSQEAAFMEVQPEEKKLKHVDPQPEGSAVGLRSSGASFGHDNTAASTLAGDRPRPQSYNGATYEDSVENRRVQSFHGVPSCRNSTGRPLDIADSTYGDDLQASRAFDAFWHAYDGGHPSPEAEMNAQPTDNLHAMLPIAHELPATPLNTRLHSPVSHQSTREGISTGSEVNGAGVHTGMDTESEASMENWREAIAERENAYDGDNDEAEHSEGIGRAN